MRDTASRNNIDEDIQGPPTAFVYACWDVHVHTLSHAAEVNKTPERSTDFQMQTKH